MDLMTLAAKLTLDDSGFKSGMSSAESLGQQFTNKMSAMTVAAGQFMYDVAKRAVSTLTGMFGSAVDSYADYQQLIGGIETLFKSSSDKVAAYAKQSFKTTGLSANDYMETVTSFSASLLQGLKGDTEAAADLANTAVQDMADNANKMGTDLSSIQTAYQGFAKQNYTMLDNLKLGYGGTKEEMVRLVNDSGILDHQIKDLNGITFDQLVEAIHAIQTQLGITGTTAKEAADTISGSKASLKASWEDLMSAVGGEGDQDRLDQTIVNFQDSFEAYMRNFIPTLTTTIMNSGTLVEGLAGALEKLPRSTLNMLVNAGLEAGTNMFDGLQVVTDWLMDSVVTFFRESSLDPSRIADFGHALGEFVGDAVGNFIKNFPDIVTGMLDVGITLAGSIVSGIWDGLFGNGSDHELQRIQDELTGTIADAEVSSARAQSILTYMDDLHKKYGDAATETTEWKTAEEELEGVLKGSKKTFETYGKDIDGAIGHLKSMSEELRKLAIQQALQESLDAQYKLLGEYTVQRETASASIGMEEQTQADISARLAGMAESYAQELLKAINAEGSMGVLGENNYVYYKGNAEEIIDLVQNGSFSDLASAMTDGRFQNVIDSLTNVYKMLGTNEEDQIWNRGGLTDENLSPETIQKMLTAYEESGTKIEESTKKYQEATEGITKVTDQITITEQAAQNIAKEMNADSTKVSTAGNNVAAALNSAAYAIIASKMPLRKGTRPLFPEMNITPGTVEDADVDFMPKATGLDFVPFNGFRTELHRGEAVLTKEENDARRRAMDYGEMEAALENAVRAGMSGMYLNMNGNKVADLTSRQTGRNLSTSERSVVRSMGG